MFNTMEVNHKNRVNWEELKNEALVYELTLPATMDNLPKGQEEEMNKGTGQYTRDRVLILEVTQILSNPKGTVKLVVLGDQRVMLFSKMHNIEGFTSLAWDRYSNRDQCDVFDNIQVGSWIIAKPGGYSGDEDLEVAFMTNEKSLTTVKEMINILWKVGKVRYEGSFQWKEKEDYSIPTYGTVKASEVFNMQVRFYTQFRQLKWTHRKERWDLFNAVRANLKMQKLTDKKLFEVIAKGLDGKTYHLICPLLDEKDKEKSIGYPDMSLFDMDFWLPFVYREKNDNFFGRLPQEQTQELVSMFIRIFDKLPRENFTFGVDDKVLTVERKRAKNEALLNYIDGKIVKAENVAEKLMKFFILGLPIIEEVVVQEGEEIKKRVMSIEAKKLIDEGLNGTMRDLEGEFPFHLNIIFKENEKKWYLEVAGKEFYVKGGYNSLTKVKNAIKGKAIIDHTKEGYDSQATKVIRGRLAELVGDEEAVQIILQVKKLGAMMKAISS